MAECGVSSQLWAPTASQLYCTVDGPWWSGCVGNNQAATRMREWLYVSITFDHKARVFSVQRYWGLVSFQRHRGRSEWKTQQLLSLCLLKGPDNFSKHSSARTEKTHLSESVCDYKRLGWHMKNNKWQVIFKRGASACQRKDFMTSLLF